MSKLSNSFTIYISSKRGDRTNTSYPVEKVISCSDELAAAAAFDNVPCRFADGKNNRGTFIRSYRNKRCFVSTNCIIMDCDNTSSDPTTDMDASQWKTPEDVRTAFPGVEFYVVYSRNHNRPKNGKSPRPKFHIYFPLDETYESAKVVERLKSEIIARFDAFDPKALKINQFMFGVENATVEHHEGFFNIDSFIKAMVSIERDERIFGTLPEVIGTGERSDTLNHFAGRALKRFGDTDRAYEAFMTAAERCEESLSDEELQSIWNSALSFYNDVVLNTAGYQSPEDFEGSLNPFDIDLSNTKLPMTVDVLKVVMEKMNIDVRMNEITGQGEVINLPSQYSKGNALNILPVLIDDEMTVRKIKGSNEKCVGEMTANP